MRVKFLQDATVQVLEPRWNNDTEERLYRKGAILEIDDIISLDKTYVNLTMGEYILFDLRKDLFEVIE